MSEITVTINGDPWQCPPGIPLLEALARLGFDPRLVALEYNGEILHRHRWPIAKLQAGDRIEIVTIVGGGTSFSVGIPTSEEIARTGCC